MGIQSFFFYEFCAEFCRQILFLYPSPSSRPPLGVPPPRACCQSCIISRFAVYCTIHLVYMFSKISLLRVLIGDVLFRQDLDIYEGAARMHRSGKPASLFCQSTTGANGRLSAGGWRQSPLNIYHTQGRCKWVSLLMVSIQPSTPPGHRSPCGVVIFGA